MINLPIEIKLKICEYIDPQLKIAFNIYIEKKLNNNYFHIDLYSNFISRVIGDQTQTTTTQEGQTFIKTEGEFPNQSKY